MPDPDYKTLCAELTNELQGYKVAHPMHCRALLNRARAALAQPESAPTDEELDDLFVSIDEGASALNWRTYARAVLAKWGTPANNTRGTH
jgi:hypothetical protein